MARLLRADFGTLVFKHLWDNWSTARLVCVSIHPFWAKSLCGHAFERIGITGPHPGKGCSADGPKTDFCSSGSDPLVPSFGPWQSFRLAPLDRKRFLKGWKLFWFSYLDPRFCEKKWSLSRQRPFPSVSAQPFSQGHLSELRLSQGLANTLRRDWVGGGRLRQRRSRTKSQNFWNKCPWSNRQSTKIYNWNVLTVTVRSWDPSLSKSEGKQKGHKGHQKVHGNHWNSLENHANCSLKLETIRKQRCKGVGWSFRPSSAYTLGRQRSAVATWPPNRGWRFQQMSWTRYKQPL